MTYSFNLLTNAIIFLAMGCAVNAGFLSNVLDFAAPKKNIEIKNWHTELCDGNHDNDRMKLHNVQVYTKDNGDLGLSGTINSTVFIYSPFSVRVTMKKRTPLGFWVKLPCVKDFGSCTYEDLCEYGYDLFTPCPPSFVYSRTPCRCPVDQGIYTVPEDVHIPMQSTRWGGIAKGDYRAKVHFIYHNNEIACYIATFTLVGAKA